MIQIQPLQHKNYQYVNSVLQANVDIYGVLCKIEDIHDFTFYELSQDDKLAGFFALGSGVISGVYIKKSFRNKSLFNKIISFVKKSCKSEPIYINTVKSNLIAVEIYSKKFQFIKEQDGVNWYLV